MEYVNNNLFWKKHPTERLALWRKFRKIYNYTSDEDACKLIWNLWIMAPTVSINIDPYDLTKWPTLWEMFQEGKCCKYSRALGAAYTLYYINPELKIEISRVYDLRKNDIYTAAIINNKYMMVDSSIDIELYEEIKNYIIFQETWNISEILDKVLYKVN
jgi:hypothetical protein